MNKHFKVSKYKLLKQSLHKYCRETKVD